MSQSRLTASITIRVSVTQIGQLAPLIQQMNQLAVAQGGTAATTIQIVQAQQRQILTARRLMLNLRMFSFGIRTLRRELDITNPVIEALTNNMLIIAAAGSAGVSVFDTYNKVMEIAKTRAGLASTATISLTRAVTMLKAELILLAQILVAVAAAWTTLQIFEWATGVDAAQDAIKQYEDRLEDLTQTMKELRREQRALSVEMSYYDAVVGEIEARVEMRGYALPEEEEAIAAAQAQQTMISVTQGWGEWERGQQQISIDEAQRGLEAAQEEVEVAQERMPNIMQAMTPSYMARRVFDPEFQRGMLEALRQGRLPFGIQNERIAEIFRGFQGGGIVTQPTFATVGEGGPEAIVPLNELFRQFEQATPEVNVQVIVPNQPSPEVMPQINVPEQELEIPEIVVPSQPPAQVMPQITISEQRVETPQITINQPALETYPQVVVPQPQIGAPQIFLPDQPAPEINNQINVPERQIVQPAEPRAIVPEVQQREAPAIQRVVQQPIPEINIMNPQTEATPLQATRGIRDREVGGGNMPIVVHVSLTNNRFNNVRDVETTGRRMGGEIGQGIRDKLDARRYGSGRP